MMESGVYFIVMALLVAELFKILIYANYMTYDVIMWTQNDVKSGKMESLWRFFLYGTETLYRCYTYHKVP